MPNIFLFYSRCLKSIEKYSEICQSLTFIVTWRRQESWENLPFVNATLALKHPGINRMEKIKNILVLNIEYPIRTFVHMSEQIECKGFLIAMELNIQVSKSQNGGCFKEVSTPFCWICYSPRERSPVWTWLVCTLVRSVTPLDCDLSSDYWLPGSWLPPERATVVLRCMVIWAADGKFNFKFF